MIESHPEPAMAHAGGGGDDRSYEPVGDTLTLSAGVMRSDLVDPADPRTWVNSPATRLALAGQVRSSSTAMGG